MKLLLETTKWKTETPNHVYIFNGSSLKIVGYVKAGTTTAIKFARPMGFDKRGRTFVEVPAKNFNVSAFS